ncbi:hypothetical protein [Laspinema olomoucense]|uniref:CheW-like domain-containing protein n=1 Tax=Laspinema olomoucense D3b TaxID=2953688 RepID=A0ABT2N937_9CYAN|nr:MULTISPECIES: hypothetical protein [unclassified Laspinema]MCT7975810.1 hypothetical protein [Laspinema sp. D3d]MCT7979203.1 hypothetical protein [Laspinema sp. D3b]
MSSSGRYQSKLFNFLQAGSRKLATQLEKAGQQIRWIAQTGGHYLLIPVYAVYQATRFVGKQLAGTANPSESSAKTLGTTEANAGTRESDITPETRPGDRPIARVLSGVELVAVAAATGDTEESWQVLVTEEDNRSQPQEVLALTAGRTGLRQRVLNWIPGKILARFGVKGDRPGTLVPVATTEQSLAVATPASAIATSRPVIQGIATLLETRSLVLISDHNQILDILTPIQQQQLQARIEGELAAAAYNLEPKSLSSQATHSALTGSPSQKQLPPVKRLRRLRQLIAGVQPVPLGNLFDRSLAKVGDLLQPSALVLQPDGVGEVPQPQGTASPRHQGQPKIEAVLLKMDAAVARWEEMQLPQGGTLSETVADRGESLLKGIQKVAIALVTDPQQDPSDSELSNEQQSLSLQMQRLIQSAVDYFFGASDQALTGSGDRPLTPTEVPGKPISQKTANVKPLTGNSEAATGQMSSNPELDQLPDSFWGVEAVEQFLTPPYPTSRRIGPSQSVRKPSRSKSSKGNHRRVQPQRSVPRTAVQPTATVTVEPTPGVSRPSPVVDSAAQLPPQVQTQAKRDWIDVEIAEVEYIMHPLEQALKWFDQILVWLEEKLIQGWQWARQQLFS